MSAHEALARVLWEADCNRASTPQWREMAWHDMGGSEPTYERTEYEIKAERILADPAPLLDALVAAGVLSRQERDYVDGGPLDGIDGRERRYVTPWRDVD